MARRLAALTLVLALAFTGCGTTTPTIGPSQAASPAPTNGSSPSVAPPSPDGTAADDAVYAPIRQQVIAIRGLQPTKNVAPVVIDEVQLRANLEKEFDAENTAAELRVADDVLQTLGLLPPGSSLRKLTLDLQAGQVAGYYSPDKDELFVVSRSGGPGPVERVTYAHEFTHQLQDQSFSLDKLTTDATDQGDRSLARLSLIEGDAVSVQNTWTVENLTSAELGELLQASLDPDAIAALRNAPAFLRETALFPYQYGLGLVQTITAQGGYDAVNAAFGAPPDSTEQVIHPELFVSAEKPVVVTIPDDVAGRPDAGWSDAGRDTLGEFVLRLWLQEHDVPLGTAVDASEGWGGDRLVLLRGPDGAVGLGLVTVWDTAADADEFASAATTAVSGPGVTGRVAHRVGTKRVDIGLGDRAADILATLRG